MNWNLIFGKKACKERYRKKYPLIVSKVTPLPKNKRNAFKEMINEKYGI